MRRLSKIQAVVCVVVFYMCVYVVVYKSSVNINNGLILRNKENQKDTQSNETFGGHTRSTYTVTRQNILNTDKESKTKSESFSGEPVNNLVSKTSTSKLITLKLVVGPITVADRNTYVQDNQQLTVKDSTIGKQNEPKQDITNNIKNSNAVLRGDVRDLTTPWPTTPDTPGDSKELPGQEASPEGRQSSLKMRNISILIYDPHQARFSNIMSRMDGSRCVYKNCQFRVHRNNSSGVLPDDVIVFQGNNMPQILPQRRDANQVFVFFNNEPQQYSQLTKYRNHPYKDQFNWTMTFRTDSDIFCPYGRIINKQTKQLYFLSEYNATPQTMQYSKRAASHGANSVGMNSTDTVDVSGLRNLFRNKRMSSLWMVGHCNTPSKREKYVQSMMNVTHIDIYGGCNSRKTGTMDRTVSRRIDSGADHKFYLSFENSLCRDYVTEKVFNWFEKPIINVVRNGFGFEKVLPPGTYINANDFKSAADLGIYLNQVASNEDLYVNYLKEKRKYRVIPEVPTVHMAFCDLCKMANHMEKNRRTVQDIHAWWNERQCKVG